MPADVPHVEDLIGSDFFPGDGVACGRAELVEAHAVMRVVVRVAEAGGSADGFAADEADAGGTFSGLDELGEEVAVDGDLAQDERLRGVKINLGAGVECPCLGADAIFEILIDFFVPSGVRCFRLNHDACPDGALCQMLDEVGRLRCVVVEPAREAQDFHARVGREFALGVGGRHPYEAAI